MSSLAVAASPARRLAASVYDGLLLIAVWVIPLSLGVGLRQLAGIDLGVVTRQLLLFAAGMWFFGWFWTHGGQTLGMRAWRVQVQRNNGAALRWPIAALRYSVMLLSWGVALTPLLLRLPHLKDLPQTPTASAITAVCTLTAVALMLFDPRRRAPCDWLSGTEVVAVQPVERN